MTSLPNFRQIGNIFWREKTFCFDKILPGQTRDDDTVDRVQGPNRFWQEFPVLQFRRQKLWPFLLQQVDDGDEEEKGGDGNEDNVDDDGAGQGEEEDKTRENQEHAK